MGGIEEGRKRRRKKKKEKHCYITPAQKKERETERSSNINSAYLKVI